MTIRPAIPEDLDAIWAILEPPIRGGEVFALPRDMDREAALAFWMAPGYENFVAEADGEVLGVSYIKLNAQGGGSHVANAGYATAPQARGRGIARALCLHSLERARERGFRAMQFNFVVSTNERAVCLWQSCGFQIVGALPGAFQHPALGEVDAYVMMRRL